MECYKKKLIKRKVNFDSVVYAISNESKTKKNKKQTNSVMIEFAMPEPPSLKLSWLDEVTTDSRGCFHWALRRRKLFVYKF